MLGNATEETDTQPAPNRLGAMGETDGEADSFRTLTDAEAISLLFEFDAQRCEERTALQIRYPVAYEPAEIDPDSPFAIASDDLAYQRGFACGYDGHLADEPSGLDEDESEAWRGGWADGYHEYINAIERDYELGHPGHDPDPWNESHSTLAGHPAHE